MPDTLSTSKNSPSTVSVEQVSDQIRLPDGHAKAEQRRISDSAYKLHSEQLRERQHERRETQEERLIELDRSSSSQLSASPVSNKIKAQASQRSREQSDQLAQAEEISPKTTKRGRSSKKGESQITLQKLATIVGEDHAEQMVEKIEQAAKQSGTGLTVNPSELKSLAENISVTNSLGNAPTSTQSIHQNESRIVELQNKVTSILNTSTTPTGDLQELLSGLSKTDARVLHTAIKKYEIEHERFALDALLDRVQGPASQVDAATEFFLSTCVPSASRSTYTLAFLEDAHRRNQETTNVILSKRSAQQRLVIEIHSDLDELRAKTIQLVEDASSITDRPLCSKETLGRYKSCSFSELRATHQVLSSELTTAMQALLKEEFPHPAHPSHGLVVQHLQQLSRYNGQLDELHARLSAIVTEIEALNIELNLRHNEYIRKTQRLREQFDNYKPIVRPLYEEEQNSTAGSTNNASSSPHRRLLESEGDEADAHTEISSTSGSGEQFVKKEESTFELRQEADRERAISVDNARNYALAGDFANAEAIITAYNNRFPQFQISRDFISEIRDKRKSQEPVP